MPTTPYITAADMRQYLPQVPVDAANTALLDAIAVRATATVNSALGFVFAGYAVGSRVVRSYGTDYLHLPPHQIGSVTAVVVGSYTIPASDYSEQPDGSLYRTTTSYTWPWGAIRGWGNSVYTVTASYGYGPVPEDIQQVTLEVAVNIWRSKDKGGFSETVGVEGAGAIRVVSGLTRQQQAVIDAVKDLSNRSLPVV